MSATHRRWLLIAGILLTLVSVGYLCLYAWRNWERLPPLTLSGSAAAWLAAACVLYFCSLLTTSGAWLSAIRSLGSAMPPKAAIGIALVAQVGKYVPGNVAQHLGRAALARDRGLPVTATAQASVLEIVAAVLAAGMLAGAASLAFPAFAFPHGRSIIAAIGVAALVGVAVTIFWLRRSANSGTRVLKGWGWMLLCYAFSFGFAGVSYFAVARALGTEPALSLCLAAYAVAWVAGFVTPGAPAGLGVRESLLVVALTPSVGPAAIAIALVHRLLTAVTDGIAAGVGALVLSGEPR